MMTLSPPEIPPLQTMSAYKKSDATTSVTTKGTRRRVFAKRFFSTVLLWSVLGAVVLINHEAAYFVLIGATGLLALWEYFQMLQNKSISTFPYFGMVSAAIFFTCGFANLSLHPTHPIPLELPLLCVFIVALFVRQLFYKIPLNARVLEGIASTTFGLLYIPFLFLFIPKSIYLIPPHIPQHPSGCLYVFYMIVVAKFSDMGAYLVGSLIGRHKVVPHISPAKTWEGFGGAIAFSLIASLGLRALMPHQLGILNWIDAVVLGIGLSIAAVIGDLAESILKRCTNVKDSGKAFPGIGGILDLVDSLLFAAPLLYFYLTWKLS